MKHTALREDGGFAETSMRDQYYVRFGKCNQGAGDGVGAFSIPSFASNHLSFIWSNITISVPHLSHFIFLLVKYRAIFGQNLHQLLGQNLFPSLAQPLSNLSNLCQFLVHFPSHSSINPDISWCPIIFLVHLTRSRFDTLNTSPAWFQCLGLGRGLPFIGRILIIEA